ncbi:MAG: OmpH family outer membrane protein [Phycisphaerales bacterium]|jgi:Skp family chaperone for outer membrane proteins|nr:OmpH family outer membrane protein [Phycisphaerales bacterium]
MHIRASVLALSLALGVGVVCYSAGVGAAPVRAAQPSAVAVINVVKLIEGLEEYKALNTALSDQRKESQKKLDAMEADLKKIGDELEVLGNGDRNRRRQLAAQGIELQGAYQGAGQGLQRWLDLGQGDIAKTLYDKALIAVERVATREGYDIVLFDDRPVTVPLDLTDREVNGIIRSKRVLFASARSEITDLVIAEMNNAYKAGK